MLGLIKTLIMKKSFYLLLFVFALFSCKQHHETRIVFENSTDYNVKVKLNPNPSAEGIKFELNLDTIYPDEGIYHIDLTDYDPRKLLSDGYYSFVVEIDNLNEDRIVFGKNTEPDYELNPYTDLDSWEYDEYNFTYKYNFSSDETLIHEYTFIISEDLILK